MVLPKTVEVGGREDPPWLRKKKKKFRNFLQKKIYVDKIKGLPVYCIITFYQY